MNEHSPPSITTPTPPTTPVTPPIPTLPTPFTDPTSARYAEEFLRLAPQDPGSLGTGQIRQSIRTAVGNSQGYILDPYTQSSIVAAIDYLARRSVTFRRLYAFSEHPPAGAVGRVIHLERLVFTTLREFDTNIGLPTEDFAHMYRIFARSGRQDSTTAYINIPPAPDILTNPNEWYSWVQVLLHEIVHMMSGALDPARAFQRQELGPTELLTNEMGSELPENLSLPRYAYNAPGLLAHVAALNRLGYDAARARTPANEFELRFLALRMPRARRASDRSISFNELQEHRGILTASTRHLTDAITGSLRAHNRVFPDTRVEVHQGSTGAHPVLTLNNVQIQSNGSSRSGTLSIECVGEFDLRNILVEVGQSFSDFSYGIQIEANDGNIQARFTPESGSGETAPPGVYVHRNGRWERYEIKAGASPLDLSPDNDTNYGAEFFKTVQAKLDTVSPKNGTTQEHYENWLDQLGLTPVKDAAFWLKGQFDKFAHHYPINRRSASDQPISVPSLKILDQAAQKLAYHVSDRANIEAVTNALLVFLRNPMIWGLSSRMKIFTERYYRIGEPTYLDFRAVDVNGYISISLMAYNFSGLTSYDLTLPSFEPYEYLTKNALALIGRDRKEVTVLDDTQGRHGIIERRYGVAFGHTEPEPTSGEMPLIVSSPDRRVAYLGQFFSRDEDSATILFRAFFKKENDTKTGQPIIRPADHPVLTPQISGREFAPYVKASLENLPESTVFYGEDGRLSLRLQMESGHGKHRGNTLTIPILQPCRMDHRSVSKTNPDGEVLSQQYIFSLEYARVFKMQYVRNLLPGLPWRRQPVLWPIQVLDPQGQAYVFEDVLALSVPYQLAAAVLGIAVQDKTLTPSAEANWYAWKQKFVDLGLKDTALNALTALTTHPCALTCQDGSLVLLISDTDIYDLGILGDTRLSFRNYTQGCLALYLDQEGHLLAWDQIGVFRSIGVFEDAPDVPREDSICLTSDYPVRPRSTYDDILHKYSPDEGTYLYVWEGKDAPPMTIPATETLKKDYPSDYRYEVIKDHAIALVDQWNHSAIGSKTPHQQEQILQELAQTDGLEFRITLDESDYSNDTYTHRFVYRIPNQWPEGTTTLQGVLHKAAEAFYTSAYGNIYPQEGEINIDAIDMSIRVLLKQNMIPAMRRVRIQKL